MCSWPGLPGRVALVIWQCGWDVCNEKIGDTFGFPITGPYPCGFATG